MIFLQAVPHDLYFQWQIEVQIVNFRKFEISQNMHICVWYPKGSQELPKWKEIQRKYPEVKIVCYEDSGVNLGLYIPQLRPHNLIKHFESVDGNGFDFEAAIRDAFDRFYIPETADPNIPWGKFN